MWKFIGWRLIQFPLILAIIYLFTFAMVWIVPGDPFSVEGRTISEADRMAMRRELNAESWHSFLRHYTVNLLTKGDLGPSFVNRAFRVNELIEGRIWVSMKIGFAALGIAVVVGMFIGTISAVRRDGILDWAGTSITLIGISLPSFVTAAVLMLVFVADLRWFRLGRLETPADLVLPALALSLAPMAYIVRLQRASLLDVLGADYVRTARAKGLSRLRVVVKHCLRNAFLPVLSYLGPATAVTLTGSFVIETVFNLDGLGRQFVASVTNRDITLILALVLIYSTLVLAMNLLVDILYAVIDPRIEVSGGGGA